MRQDGNETAESRQIGGDHYKRYAIQPARFAHVNKLPYLYGSVIKRLLSYLAVPDRQELEKAKHEIDLILQYDSEEAG